MCSRVLRWLIDFPPTHKHHHTTKHTQFKGQPIRVPYAFVTEAAEHPSFPRYHCPALIIHGLKDEVCVSCFG